MRLVHYSLAFGEPRADLCVQLEASLESLRRHNRRQAVVLFAHSALPLAVERAALANSVEIVKQPPYPERLGELHPVGAHFLSGYPLLHKFMNGRALSSFGATQALYLDCDTLFFGDVARLFDDYADAHCVAREEPTCRRSHYGHDPAYLDESAVSALAAALGLSTPPPFNLGVVLLNGSLIPLLQELEACFLDYAFRFMLGMARSEGAASAFGELAPVTALRARLKRDPSFGAVDLPYPSANPWILDEVALWFALGHLPDARYRDFARSDVAQNGELLELRPEHTRWVVGHYFSQNMERVSEWLSAG
jgi:hypothetical protein